MIVSIVDCIAGLRKVWSRTWKCFFMAALLATSGSKALAASAETTNFQESNKMPVGAETTFFTPTWTDGDEVRTAQHELLHAIGFAIAYQGFGSHVDGSRQFRLKADATGTVLGKLTPATDGTHIDPNAGTVNGFDQSKSVMGPTNVNGQRMGGQEKSILDAGFDWVGNVNNINIAVTFSGTWSTTDKKVVNDAVAEAKKLLDSDGSGPTFSWTVKLAAAVPSTSALVLQLDQVSVLVEMLSSTDSAKRMGAAATLLSQPGESLPLLVAAGAKDMTGLNPPLVDVLFSIVAGDRGGRYKTNVFGLHLELGTTREDVQAMGERSGFELPPDSDCDPEKRPACYVSIREGGELWDVMANLIATEPRVLTVNLNYFER